MTLLFVNKIFKITPQLLLIGGLMLSKSLFASDKQTSPGLNLGELNPCGAKPNCVCSVDANDKDHFIAPIENEKIDQLWSQLKQNLKLWGLNVVEETDNYIHATAQTRILKFTDDVEFLYQPEKKQIQMRSASRVGYSDLGANRKRLEDIRFKLHQSTNFK